ncbi:MAG: hypothetical protein IT462_08705 [Planctomycetes bacterium]|nr:hypothetical protein [Planctomycetota bacterium]
MWTTITARIIAEYLVVGFGHKRRGTKISHVHFHVGAERTVDVSPSLEVAIHRHLQSSHEAEVVIFHNHPMTLEQALFNHGPLASQADRNVWLSYLKNLPLLLKRILGGGHVHFYLGENGKVREFDSPNFLQIVHWLLRKDGA